MYTEQQGRQGNSTTQKAITKSQWQDVLNSLRDVKITAIANMEAPSQERARDAALHSQLIISTGSNVYTSTTFDDHKAPKPLLPLMKTVLALKQEK